MSRTLHGTTSVTVGDETYELKPTLAAVRSIEAHFGGLRGAAQALYAMSVDGVAHIIASGAGLNAKQAQELPEQVWQHGVVELIPAVNSYLGALYDPRGGDLGKGEREASVP